MAFSKLLPVLFLPATIFFSGSCNSNTKQSNESKITGTTARDTSAASTSPPEDGNNKLQTDDSTNSRDTAVPAPADNADSMLAKGMAALFGNADSGLLKNLGGGKNMDSMMQKMQSIIGGKNGNPGDAISRLLLNTQLGQMSDANPIKAVAKGMQQAQDNGTAGPSKTYTAVYTAAQPVDYAIPVSGNGNSILLQYSGGTISNGKKNGLWKNIYISSLPGQWNVFTEGYVESAAINMKVHASSLEGVNENYTINLNEQYKKFEKQYRSEAGKNESDVQVQKIGNEKMFGYSCVHVKIAYAIKGLGQTAQEVNDEWYSAEVPGASFVSPVIFENHAPAVVKKILDAGCAGVLVRSVINAAGSSYVLQLSSITKKDMPATTFILPKDYTEDKNTVLYDIQ